ncbi:MAG: hypothetical protein ACREL9_12325 [Gemmatimonadales bacterium]
MTTSLVRLSAILRTAIAVASVLVFSTCTDRPTPPAAGPNAVVLVGAGNIARCDRQNDEQAALLLDGILGTVFTAGDNVYAGGATSDFQNCYGPSWGRHAGRTRPPPGDDDHKTAGVGATSATLGRLRGRRAGDTTTATTWGRGTWWC